MPGMIERSIPWLIQPQYPVGVDRGNLSGLFERVDLLPSGLIDWTKNGTVSILTGRGGIGPAGNGTTGYYNHAISLDPAAPHVLLASFTAQAVSTTAKTVYGLGSNAATNGAFIRITSGANAAANIAAQIRSLDGTSTPQLCTGPVPVIGSVYNVCFVLGGVAAADNYMYVNGVRYGATGIDLGASGSTLVHGAIGALLRGAVDTFSPDIIHLVARGRALPSENQARALSQNPWQIFQPIQRKIWVASAGAAQNLEGAAAAAATAAAALSVSIPLAGAGITVATASGAMSVAIPLAGAGVITYTRPAADNVTSTWATSSGTDFFALIDEVDPNDSDYVTSSVNADVLGITLAPMVDPGTHTGHKLKLRAWAPSGTGYLSYSIYASYAEYLAGGTELAAGLLTLTAAPAVYIKPLSPAIVSAITDFSALFVVMQQFGSNATLVSQVWYEVTSSGFASASGALTEGVPLTGAATATANSSGGLNLSIPLSGSAVAQALAQAGITHGVPLSAAAAAVAAATGGLSINVSLSGAAIAAAAASAGLTVAGDGLQGSAAAAASASGALTHAVPLSGASLAVSSASGTLTHLVPLSSAAAAASLATGGLDVSVKLSGAALASALAAATLSVTSAAVDLAGAASAIAAAGGTITLRVNLDGAAVAQAIAAGALASDGLITAGTPGYRVTRTPRTWQVTRTPRTWKVSA